MNTGRIFHPAGISYPSADKMKKKKVEMMMMVTEENTPAFTFVLDMTNGLSVDETDDVA